MSEERRMTKIWFNQPNAKQQAINWVLARRAEGYKANAYPRKDHYDCFAQK